MIEKIRISLIVVVLTLSSAMVWAQSAINAAPEQALLLEFEAHRHDDRVELRWITNGSATQSFIVQRSLDRKTWSSVLEVNGSNSIRQSIEYFDIDIDVPSVKLYYRIELKEHSGRIIYSRVVFVPSLDDILFFGETKSIKTFSGSLSVGSIVTIPGIESPDGKSIILVLRSTTGQNYYAKVAPVAEVNTFEIVDASAIMPIGSYIITASSQNNIYNSMIIVE